MKNIGEKDFPVVMAMGEGDNNGDGGAYAHLQGAAGFHTLCGYCDVQGIDTDKYMSEVDVPLCGECVSVVAQARTFKRTMVIT